MKVPDVEPWDVWWVRLDPQSSHEQAGRRPAIVVGTEVACQIPNNLAVVVPCTHTDRRLPWQPRVSLGGDPSFAMCDQFKAIDKRRLQKPHGCGALTDPGERVAIARVLRQLIMVKVGD